MVEFDTSVTGPREHAAVLRDYIEAKADEAEDALARSDRTHRRDDGIDAAWRCRRLMELVRAFGIRVDLSPRMHRVLGGFV